MRILKILQNSLKKKKIFKIVQPYTLVSQKRINNLYELARRIESDKIPGDVVECGVYNGGTAAILAHFATKSPLDRTVWLFDSFEGMPQTTEADGKSASKYIGKVVGNIDNVNKVLKMVDTDMERVRIMKGLFQQTFQSILILKIALLNIDADWYESVKLCLETFYDAVVPGGIISIDDYGHWPGCKKAVDEFFHKRNLNYDLQEVDYTARWFEKE